MNCHRPESIEETVELTIKATAPDVLYTIEVTCHDPLSVMVAASTDEFQGSKLFQSLKTQLSGLSRGNVIDGCFDGKSCQITFMSQELSYT